MSPFAIFIKKSKYQNILKILNIQQENYGKMEVNEMETSLIKQTAACVVLFGVALQVYNTYIY